jgi:hypothetical protein
LRHARWWVEGRSDVRALQTQDGHAAVLYWDEGRPIGVPIGYQSIVDWDLIKRFERIEEIPERHRDEVRKKGFQIYWLRIR